MTTTRTVYFILQWRGDYWRPMDSEADRLWAIPYATRGEAAEALADYLGPWPEDYRSSQFMIWEARGYPKEGPNSE